jgi:hypothetical protein
MQAVADFIVGSCKESQKRQYTICNFAAANLNDPPSANFHLDGKVSITVKNYKKGLSQIMCEKKCTNFEI